MIERTLVIVKPDGVERGLVGEILRRFENAGMKIIGMNMVWIDSKFAEQHYKAHKSKPFFRELVEFITEGPVVAFAVEGDRKSTRLNSSHSQISYAVFCLKKK